jgi:hypothetical protein
MGIDWEQVGITSCFEPDQVAGENRELQKLRDTMRETARERNTKNEPTTL